MCVSLCPVLFFAGRVSSEPSDLCLEQCCSVLLYFLELLVKYCVRSELREGPGSGLSLLLGSRHRMGLRSGSVWSWVRLNLRLWLQWAQSMVGVRAQSGTMCSPIIRGPGLGLLLMSRTGLESGSKFSLESGSGLSVGLQLGLKHQGSVYCWYKGSV